MSDDYDTSDIQVFASSENLYALIDQIKRRPGMYFENESITALYHFIIGYHQACAMKGIEEEAKPRFGDFHEFVRRKTNFSESTCGWKNMLLSFNDSDEAKAMAMFFVLFDEFRAQYFDCSL